MASAGPEETGLLFIGGEWVASRSDRWQEVHDPSTGRRLGRVSIASREEASAAVDAAAGMEESWGSTAIHERARLLRALADRLAADQVDMARLIAQEVGKPIVDARVEATRAITVYQLAADEARHLTGESFPADAYAYPVGNERRFLFSVRDPIGVVVAISPFNFPLNLLSHKVAPALAAGNPVVIKPTSTAPLTALRLAKHAEAAGFPKGVINVVVGPGGEVGDTLVEHPRTRLVTFTGSTVVGKSIAEKAGRHAKRVILEMGGMDPFIVLDDAPLDVTVAAAVRGAFGYSGQVCTASKRLLVSDAVADRFAQALTERAGKLKMGLALAEDTQVGPVIDPATLDRMDRLIGDAVSHSAKVLLGGQRASELAPGYFYRPTVLDSVTVESKIAQEEPFGPVVPILRFHDIDEAIQIANGTPYGLQAAVYTNDLKRAFAIAKRIHAGGVHINDPTSLRWDALPFGGVKESGLGREGLRYAMEEMTEVKLISVNYG
ncbi:MAG: aldehyde dehydrogenase family protein [Thermoplasmata archaeon]